jgi:glycolate oxidase
MGISSKGRSPRARRRRTRAPGTTSSAAPNQRPLRRRHAFDRIAFRPRILVDVSNVDPSTTFLGHKLRIPAILAPIGSLQVFDPEGAVSATRGATEYGILHCVSSVTLPSLEDTAGATPTPKFFQL